jgi:hypothetical protein
MLDLMKVYYNYVGLGVGITTAPVGLVGNCNLLSEYGGMPAGPRDGKMCCLLVWRAGCIVLVDLFSRWFCAVASGVLGSRRDARCIPSLEQCCCMESKHPLKLSSRHVITVGLSYS